MLKYKKNYRWFATLTLLFGLVVFGISLVSAMAGGRMQVGATERSLYFDRKILPDHVLYPVLVAVDRLELEFSTPEEKMVLRMDYATKRLEAAKALFYQDKNELALITLGKAHQYLLQANDDVWRMGDKGKYLTFIVELNKQFRQEYQDLKIFMNDSQQARAETMREELKAVGDRL